MQLLQIAFEIVVTSVAALLVKSDSGMVWPGLTVMVLVSVAGDVEVVWKAILTVVD